MESTNRNLVIGIIIALVVIVIGILIYRGTRSSSLPAGSTQTGAIGNGMASSTDMTGASATTTTVINADGTTTQVPVGFEQKG